MDNAQIFPHFLYQLSTRWILVINDEGLAGPCDGCVEELEVGTKLSIVVNILHDLLDVADYFFYFDCVIFLINDALSIDLFFLLLYADLRFFLRIPLFKLCFILFFFMSGQRCLVLLFRNFIINDFQIFEKIPLLGMLTFRKEVKKNNVIELESLCFVNR